MADDRLVYAANSDLGMIRSDPVMELVWESGQVLVRGFPSNPSCGSYPPSALKFQAENDDESFGSKTRRFDNYSGQDECSKLQSSMQQDHHAGLFPGLYQNDFNLFFETTRNFDGVDSQVVPVCKNASSRNGSKLNPQHTVPELLNQETESDRHRFEMQRLSVPETIPEANNKSRIGFGTSRPEGMRTNMETLSTKMKFVAEPRKESLVDEQFQAAGHKNTAFQYCPDKVLVPDKEVKEKSRDQTVGITSMCSRASNDFICRSPRRRHEDDDLTTSPSNNIEDEKTSSYTEAYSDGERVCFKRKRSTEVHNMSERKRRAKINKKMRELQELIPNSDKVDKASMLDQAIEYLKTLQLQIQIMQMARCTQPMMLPGHVFAPLGMGMHMGSFGCNPSMYSASSMLGMPGQMIPMTTLSQPPFMPLMGCSSSNSFVPLPHSFPGLATPGEFLASTSLLRSHDSNSGNVQSSKMQTSSRR